MTLRLNQVERDSATWQKVRAEINERLARYRQKVENPAAPEAERLGLCWQIKELKALLQMEQPETNPGAGE